jgi:hypothetical protein
MTIKKWNEPNATGHDIGPAGNPVSSEKQINMLSH